MIRRAEEITVIRVWTKPTEQERESSSSAPVKFGGEWQQDTCRKTNLGGQGQENRSDNTDGPVYPSASIS
jgi:hypothetical protein